MIELRTRPATTHGDVTVLDASGRLDLLTAPEFRARIADAIAGGTSRLVVDFERVEFVDSSGLGALVAALKLARRAGGDLRICGASEQLEIVLDLTGLDRVLRPYPGVDDAVGSF